MSDQLDLWPEDQPGDRIRWSVTRHARLQDCARKYYYQYYGSRGGWGPDATPETRELHILKYLRNRFMWVGLVVHEMVELALASWRRGDTVPADALVERGTRRMRAQYAESLQRVYRDRPARACGLVEHEYDEEISRDEWKGMRDRMERCVRAFFDLELAKRIRETPTWRWLALESAGSFDFDGATILVKPDFAWREPDGTVVLVDWKSGKPRESEEMRQLGVYALFARRSWSVAPEQIRGRVAYLDGGFVRDILFTPEDLTGAEEMMQASLTRMRELIADAPSGEPPMERFAMVEDREPCSRCNFRRICDRA